jgi:hypothetical protein
MSETALLCFFMALVAFLFAISAYTESHRYDNLTDICKKQHNVYECELAAVPKEQSK